MAAAGLLLCTAWYYTILSGFYILYCPVMYLMFLNHKWYRKTVDLLFELWELYPVALFQCCFNTQLHHFGDYVSPNENTIIVMNHRTRVDWNYVWIALYNATKNPDTEKCSCKEKSDFIKTEESFFSLGGKSKMKFVLKDEIKTIPGMGWIMQLNFFLYVKRDWREDQLSMSKFVEYYSRLQYDCRLVLFPEGTDLSDDNRRKSYRFAVANNLPVLPIMGNASACQESVLPQWIHGFEWPHNSHYDFVLHPRTTGWAALCSRLRSSGLTSVYDVTVAYDTPAQTELQLLRGKIPRKVYFYFKRYSIAELPTEDKDLRCWLNERWRDKEASLRKFHSDGNFIDPTSNKAPPLRPPRELFLAKMGFVFWTLLDILFTYALLNSVVFKFWVIYHSLLFVFVTWYFGGFHNIQYQLLENKHV